MPEACRRVDVWGPAWAAPAQLFHSQAVPVVNKKFLWKLQLAIRRVVLSRKCAPRPPILSRMSNKANFPPVCTSCCELWRWMRVAFMMCTATAMYRISSCAAFQTPHCRPHPAEILRQEPSNRCRSSASPGGSAKFRQSSAFPERLPSVSEFVSQKPMLLVKVPTLQSSLRSRLRIEP